MRLNRFLLVDVNSSWQSVNQIPATTLAYLQSSALSAAFRRTLRGRGRFLPARSLSMPSIRSPEFRRPRDWSSPGDGLSFPSSDLASTSQSPEGPELDSFLELVPVRMRKSLVEHPEIGTIVEVVLDLGRQPIARFPSGDWFISDEPVQLQDLQHAISKVGDFSDDNRSGINHSLHRISAIRNRKRQIIGLTCRVGRAVSGSAEIVRDLVEGGGSILVIGPPGVGKTTMIREIARMLADDRKKRVIIIDTSNEIGGDGDVPHSGIGGARRMQVPNVNMQHNVMIEAVENHMPQAIIIDEIGTELEALAASTIAQRGVQLVATAHGETIDNIMKNPSLQILVGGIESVTLGDVEARRRGVQKTVLERKGPPTFSCAVEMISRTECSVHHRLDATVDAILAGRPPLSEFRRMDVPAESSSTASKKADEASSAEISSEEAQLYEDEHNSSNLQKSSSCNESKINTQPDVHITVTPKENKLDSSEQLYEGVRANSSAKREEDYSSFFSKFSGKRHSKRSTSICVYAHKIPEADLRHVAVAMGYEEEIHIANDVAFADAILTSASELKENPWIRTVAKSNKLPIYVIKSNTMAQMVKAINVMLGRDSFGTMSKQTRKRSLDIEIEDDAPRPKPSMEEIDALEEVRLAIEYIVIPSGEPVELLPRCAEIVAQQLELVKHYQLTVENSGTDLDPRLQIIPKKSGKNT